MDNTSKALTTTHAGELAQFGEMSVATIVDRKRKILEVMNAVMKDGEHFGKIPGCGDKPTLLKAGAEVLATTFGLAPQFKITRTDLANGHREYEIVCTLHHIATGAVVGEGVGCASTMESKYRWRGGSRVCPKCAKAAIIKGKAEYGGGWVCFDKRGGCGAKWKDGAAEIESQQLGRVENPDLADVFNTVLKMAKKRAQVDCTLTAVGASDLLTQDLEDLPPGTTTTPANDSEPVPRAKADRKPAERTPKKRESTPETTADKAPPAEPLTADEVEDLVEQLAKCGTEAALKSLSEMHKPRTALLDVDTRRRLAKVYSEQLGDIRAANAGERRAG